MVEGPTQSGTFIRAGPGGDCICPKCKHVESHIRGTPCARRQCSKCGANMVRQ